MRRVVLRQRINPEPETKAAKEKSLSTKLRTCRRWYKESENNLQVVYRCLVTKKTKLVIK